MKFFKSINSTQQFNRVIHFDKPEMEHYRIYKQSGGEFVVDFKYRITPNRTDEIKVFYEETSDNMECIPYIFQGVESFLKNLNSNKICIRGFDIEVYDCVIVPTDFKPYKYAIYSALTFARLVFDRGTKSVKTVKNNFHQLSAKSFNSFLHSSDRLKTDRSKYFNTGIHLPNRGLPIKSLKQNVDIILRDSFGDSAVNIKLFGMKSVRNDNSISIHTKLDNQSATLITSVFQELIQLKTDIYSTNYDLSGFEIFLECTDLKYINREIGRELYWHLLELIE